MTAADYSDDPSPENVIHPKIICNGRQTIETIPSTDLFYNNANFWRFTTTRTPVQNPASRAPTRMYGCVAEWQHFKVAFLLQQVRNQYGWECYAGVIHMRMLCRSHTYENIMQESYIWECHVGVIHMRVSCRNHTYESVMQESYIWECHARVIHMRKTYRSNMTSVYISEHTSGSLSKQRMVLTW